MPDAHETKVTHRYAATPDRVYEALQKAVVTEGYDPKADPSKLSFDVADGHVTIVVEPGPDGSGTVVTLYDEQTGTGAEIAERGWQLMLETVGHTL